MGAELSLARSVVSVGAGQNSHQGLSLTSWCLHQPCLSPADRRTSAWRRWQLRVTAASAVCVYVGPQGAGSHTAAARPVGKGMWLRASLPGPWGALCLLMITGMHPGLGEERAMSSQLVSGSGSGGTPKLGLNSGPDPSMSRACPLGAVGSHRGGEP